MKRKSLALILCLTVVMAACSTSWITTAENIISVALPAVDSIFQLISLFGGTQIATSDIPVAQTAINQTKADLEVLRKLLNDYNAATAANKLGVYDKIEAVLNVLQNDLGQIMPALHISNVVLKDKIAAAIAVVGDEVAAVAALILTVQNKPVSAKKAAMAKVKTAKQFKSEFNQTISRPTGQDAIDRVTPTLEIK